MIEDYDFYEEPAKYEQGLESYYLRWGTTTPFLDLPPRMIRVVKSRLDRRHGKLFLEIYNRIGGR